MNLFNHNYFLIKNQKIFISITSSFLKKDFLKNKNKNLLNFIEEKRTFLDSQITLHKVGRSYYSTEPPEIDFIRILPRFLTPYIFLDIETIPEKAFDKSMSFKDKKVLKLAKEDSHRLTMFKKSFIGLFIFNKPDQSTKKARQSGKLKIPAWEEADKKLIALHFDYFLCQSGEKLSNNTPFTFSYKFFEELCTTKILKMQQNVRAP